MKCNQVQEKLLRSIGEELSPQIREHLLGCEECERKYRILQETEKSLKDFGAMLFELVLFRRTAPPFPPVRRRSFWLEIRDKLKTPVPVWVPSAIGVVGLLLFVVAIFAPFTPSVEWGARKGSENTGRITPPSQRRGCWNFSLCPNRRTQGSFLPQLKRLKRS